MSNFDYREMLGIGKPFKPSNDILDKLALCMSGLSKFPDRSERLRHENSVKINANIDLQQGIPAGYTYLGQFIDHDISFDSISDRFIAEHRPWEDIDPKLIKNLRNPNFNLETIYGVGTPNNRSEFPNPELMQENSRMVLRLDDTVKDPGVEGKAEKNSYPNDLPRKKESVMADIVDPRNDENLLLAQTQVAFTKFHNAVVLKLKHSDEYKDRSEEEIFKKARKITIRHYQFIILNDFLRKIVKESVLEDVKKKVVTNELFYQPTRCDMFIPLEFSVAAFRIGHSMIRNIYKLNINQPEAGLAELAFFTGRGRMEDNRDLLNLPSSWIVNWYSFYNIDGSDFNAAEKINTEIASALQMLRPQLEPKDDPAGRGSSLSALDLYRGRSLGLPSGQAVARKMQLNVLPPEKIRDLLLAKKFTDLSGEAAQKRLEEISRAFSHETPLWFYILAEAEIQNKEEGSECMGEVGSRIVAEVILKLLYESEYSVLRDRLEDDKDFLAEDKKTFGMPEMLKFVRDTNKKYFSELYPDRTEYFDELNPLGDTLDT